MKTETSVVVEKYKDSIFSAAFNVCANAADAEDVVQDTFIRYHTTNTQFADEQHIRAWLLRVAINKAKNVTMSFWRRRGVPLEDYAETLAFPSPEAGDLFEKVMKLPEKYRIVIHLFYYEGLLGAGDRRDTAHYGSKRKGAPFPGAQTAEGSVTGGLDG